MGDFAPTTAQLAAIDLVDCSALVSAGAGSGKTAVLAERCAHLVADLSPPCPIDAVLVVTFTDAAAGQMRERIESTLRRRLRSDPRNRFLHEQLALIDTASISTIHSFCRRVLNRFFTQAELDPQTPILDAQDAELLRRETAQALLERITDSDSRDCDALLHLIACHAGADESRLIDSALRIHAYLDSITDPASFLSAAIERQETRDGSLHPFWVERLTRHLHDELAEQYRFVQRGIEMIRVAPFSQTPGFERCLGEYLARIVEWGEATKTANSAECLEQLCESIRVFEFPDIPRRSKAIPEAEKSAMDRAKQLAESCRDTLFKKRLMEPFGPFRAASAGRAMAQTIPNLKSLIDFVRQFSDAYQSAKRDLGAMDFADLERKTYDLLRDEANGVAARLRAQYRFVLVDEFQDVNPIQEAILRLVSREGDTERSANLFAVGDVKQSIYAFRLAEPRLFLERMNRFRGQGAESNARGVCIDLAENFRSRPQLIDSINALCERFMTAELGGIDYDEHARLKATRPPASQEIVPLELHLLAAAPRGVDDDAASDNEGDGLEWEQIEREAYVVARRIRELAVSGCAYRDIVILMRSMKARAGLFVRTLMRQGVPVFADTAGGMFDSLEIMDVLAVLTLLDNPRQDIPWAALLRSPLAGQKLTEDELAVLRLATRATNARMPFWETVRWYSRHGTDIALRGRLTTLLQQIDRWRARARRRPLADVLWEIYEQSGYLAYVAGLRDGPQRHANLLRLHEYARQFGTFNRQGLYRFLRFVEALRESDQDLEGGAVVSAAQDVVRMMTVHRAKGLEFPVVILAELGKKMNLEDSRGSILRDRNLGIVLEAVDLEKRIRYATIAHRLVSQSVREECLAEEQRVLYVALTRACERLILVGTTGQRAWEDACARFAGHVGPLPILDRKAAVSVLDWIIPAVACRHDASRVADNSATEAARFGVIQYSFDEMKSWTLDRIEPPQKTAQLDRFTRLEPFSSPTGSKPDADAVASVTRRLSATYAAEPLTRIPSIVAASVLKRRWDASFDADEPVGRLPTISATEKTDFTVPRIRATSAAASAALPDPVQRGTWTHAFLQHVNLSAPCDESDLRRQLETVTASAKLSPPEAAHIDLDAVAWFMQGELGRRLRTARRVLREWPFVLRVEPGRYDPALSSLPADAEGDFLLVRGMIDCLFETDSGWEILDYKTDGVTPAEVLARAADYRGQLDIYATAASRTLSVPIDRRWLVFLTPRTVCCA